MPWQLTVGELKEVLSGASDGAVVLLKVPAGHHLGHPELETGHNLRHVRIGGPVVVLAAGFPPGPDIEALAEAAAVLLPTASGAPVSRPRIAARLYERLHGKRRYWQCYLDGIITGTELRDVLVNDALDAVAGEVPRWDQLSDGTQTAIVKSIDEALEHETGGSNSRLLHAVHDTRRATLLGGHPFLELGGVEAQRACRESEMSR